MIDSTIGTQGNTKDFQDILAHANMLIERDEKKNDAQTAMLALHRLEWGENIFTKPQNVRETRDTQPYDAVNWGVDILSVHEPSITVELPLEQPPEEAPTQPNEPQIPDGLDAFGLSSFGDSAPQQPTDQTAQPPVGGGSTDGTIQGQANGGVVAPDEKTELGETLEAVVRNALRHNDLRRKSALIRDFLYSVFLFDEAIAKVADLRMSPQWDNAPASFKTRSPFAIKACLPMTVHSEWDEFGLAGVLHRYKRPLREVKNEYADQNDAVKLYQSDPDGNVVYCEWWTRDEFCTWIEKSGVKSEEKLDPNERTDSELPLDDIQANTLGFIPFIIRTGRGSQLFASSEEQISPLLYGGWKAKIFYRTNLFLSIAATLAYAESNPQWKYKTATGEKTIDLNFNTPNVIPLETTEDLEKLELGMNPDIVNMLQEFTQRGQQTTLSKVVAGQVPQGVSAAAAINLMVQGSKLTIVPAQNAVGEMYALIAQMIFDYIKAYGESDLKVMLHSGVKPISPAQIPNWLNVKVELRADMPQDKALLYNIATQAWKSGFAPLKAMWDLVGVEDKVQWQKWLDEELRNATPEEMTQGKVSAPVAQKLTADQQAQQQQAAQQQGTPPQMGDATTQAMSQGLPIANNAQADNPMLDAMNASQNMLENPAGR